MERWIGDKKNGICLREEEPDGILDEVLIYINGSCVMHMEAMSEVMYWFGLYVGEHTVHMNIYSRRLRAIIDAKAEIVT